MALTFGKYRYNNFRGIAKAYFTIEIWKKDHADLEPNGDVTLYPNASQAREFDSNNAFINYWTGQGNTVPGWSWSSSFGGSAQHTAGASDELTYQLDNNLLVNGAQYTVTIELDGISNPQSANQIRVELGTATTSGFYTNGTHTEIVTAGGGQLRLDPSYNFQGYVKNIELKRYFAPATEFKTQGEGFTVTWNGQGGTRNRQFLASECKINYLVDNATEENFLYQAVTGGNRNYFVRIYRSQFPYDTTQGTALSQIFWYGYLMPAFDAIQNNSFPYVFTLTANDSYGLYGKQEIKTFANEDEKTARHSIKNILRQFLVDMDLGTIAVDGQYDLTTNLDWWQTTDTYNSFNPATYYHVAKGFVTKPTTYNENGTVDVNQKPFEYKPIDVFNGVLKALNMVGFQSNGSYWFIQPNSLIDNTTGTLTFYQYRFAGAFPNPNGSVTIPLVTEIKQQSTQPTQEITTDPKILAGSTITYEPALKSVEINFQPGFSNFTVSSGQDLTTEFYAGSLQTGTGHYNFTFHAKVKEKFDGDDFNFNSPVDNIDWTFIDSAFLTTGSLKIKITDGSQTKYLVSTNNNLEWVTSYDDITIYRGYNAPQDDGVNNSSELCIGLVSDNIPTNIGGNSSGPCQRYFAGGSNFKTITVVHFEGIVQDPGFSGDIFLEFDATNNYFQAVRNDPTGALPSYEWTYDNINNPSIDERTCKAVNITLTPTSQNNEEDADVTNGIKYKASQNEIDAIENEDLGDIRLGRNVSNLMYAIQYDSNPAIGVQNWQSVLNFQRGNPAVDDAKNPTQLLINEYLQMGVEPLEILQADLRHSFASPKQVLKYSINNDGNFKYYMFLGGTYKAKSETLSGEWYKISDQPASVVIDETPAPTPETEPPIDTDIEGFVLGNTTEMLINDSLGVSSTAITHSTQYTKVNFATTTKGKVYNGQKLVLCYPDGSNSLVLTVSGDQDLTVSGIDVAAFTPRISYPIGSILRPLIYDFTNVITGGGSTLENLYQGITTTYINLSAKEFNITSLSNLHMYTRDNLGSVQPSSFVNRSKCYATCFIPLNYEVTAVDIYSSANRNIRVLTARITNDTTTVQGSGTSNTTLTLSTAYASVAGEYLILEYEFGANTDEIRGAKITIQAV
tara:strand:- start:1432 stop:4818 length:3387 start_codon:yes stop_codon:yes gene_type:complete